MLFGRNRPYDSIDGSHPQTDFEIRKASGELVGIIHAEPPKIFRETARVSLFQDAPDHFSHASSLALRQVSDEHLQLLIGLARDQEAGLCRAVTEGESAALAAYEAAVAAVGTV